MKLNRKWIIGIVAVVGLMVVGMLAVSVLAGTDRDGDAGRETQPDADESWQSLLGVGNANAQQVAPTATEANESDESVEANESNEVDESNEANEGNEANETGEGNEVAPASATTNITPDQAQAIAVTAYPGTKAVGAVEFETYKSIAVYSVDLNTGLDVFVDAETGQIVGTKQE